MTGLAGLGLGASSASAAGFSISTIAGSGAACGTASGAAPTCGDGTAATAAELNGPDAVAADAEGNVFVADTGDNEIRRISSSGTITTVAGNGVQCTGLNTCGDGGPATSAKLSGPRGVAVDSAGNVYVADTGDNAIRMFTPGGSITAIAGSGSQCTTSGNTEKPTCGDGGPATTASFNSPRGVAVDSAGNVLVADTLDHEIRRFAVGGSIAQIAGSGSQCTTAGATEKPTCGDGGPAATAQLSAPEGVAVDSAHNVYVADAGDHEIREFAAGGTISTVAGNGTSCAAAGGTPKPTCGDGGAATNAQLGSPSGVAVDSAGNIDIADTNDAEARRVATDATINTIAGTGNVCAPATSSCNDGPATNAQLNAPHGIGVGQGESVYVGDTGDHKVRLLTPAAASNPARPLAIISSPSNAGTFTLNHAVALSFACREGAGGPGLQSCRVCEVHPGVFSFGACTAAGSSFASTVRLNTTTLGIHTYTVTAVSRDGQSGTATLQYTVSRKRPLVYAPPAVLAQVTQPCVMYRCKSNPATHTNYENSLTGMATDWCANYGCQHRMDLLPVNGFDDNLFPFNPDWAGFLLSGRHQPPFPINECGQFQTANPADWGPFCTTQQVSTDQGNHGSGYFCNMGRDPSSSFHGHVNWEPATYEGRLQWFEASPGTDDDYSLDLHPFNLDGVTAGNNGGNSIHIEFDSDETIDHFDDSEPWHSFHLAVDDESPQSAHYIDGDLAEVTGLVGVDAAHTPAAELHPVYAMAVQLDRSAALSGHNDEWMIFARNWGDEGYCSSHDHPIPAGPITVRIPWLNGARGVNLITQPRPATGVKNVGSFFEAMNTAHPGITERVLPGEGVLLTFDLSTNPSNEPEYWGHIYLKWTFTPHQLPVGGLPAGSPGNRAPTPAVHRPSVGDDDVEGAISALIHRLSVNVRRTLLASISPLAITSHRAKRVRITMRPAPIAPLVKPGAFFLATPTDRPILKRDREQVRALCRAYRNRLPGFPAACRAVLRR